MIFTGQVHGFQINSSKNKTANYKNMVISFENILAAGNHKIWRIQYMYCFCRVTVLQDSLINSQFLSILTVQDN